MSVEGLLTVVEGLLNKKVANNRSESLTGNPDYLFTPFEYGEDVDKVRRFKKEPLLSGDVTIQNDFSELLSTFQKKSDDVRSFNYDRIGISIWPKLDKRPSSLVANEDNKKLLIRDKILEDRTKLRPKKITKEEKAEKQNMTNSEDFLFAVFNGDTEKVRKLSKLTGIDWNIRFEKLQANYYNTQDVQVEEFNEKMIGSWSSKKIPASLELPKTVHDALKTNLKIGQSASSFSPTPLFWAITFHHNDILKILLKHPGIDINQIDPTIHATALHEAVFVKNHKAVRMLLARRRFAVMNKVTTSWDVSCQTGLSALMAAMSYTRTDSSESYTKCAKYILESGRKMDLEVKYCGKSLMEMAKICNTVFADEYLRLLDQGRRCWTCETSRGVRVCRSCRRALYCGLACQEEDWDRHRRYCLLKLKARRIRRDSQQTSTGEKESLKEYESVWLTEPAGRPHVATPSHHLTNRTTKLSQNGLVFMAALNVQELSKPQLQQLRQISNFTHSVKNVYE